MGKCYKYGTHILHIGMILFALGLNPYGFTFGTLPQRPHINRDSVYIYILMIIPMFSQCGTFGRTLNNPPLKQRTTHYPHGPGLPSSNHRTPNNPPLKQRTTHNPHGPSLSSICSSSLYARKITCSIKVTHLHYIVGDTPYVKHWISACLKSSHGSIVN